MSINTLFVLATHRGVVPDAVPAGDHQRSAGETGATTTSSARTGLRQTDLGNKGKQWHAWFNASKLGGEAEGLDFAPYPGELGSASLKCQQRRPGLAGSSTRTMLISENRLGLADPRARRYLAEQMNTSSPAVAEVASGYVPPAK